FRFHHQRAHSVWRRRVRFREPQRRSIQSGKSYYRRSTARGPASDDQHAKRRHSSTEERMSMFCTNCGNEVEQHARFCSKCGTEAAGAAVSGSAVAPARPKKTEHDMGMHVNILGWLLVGSGILTAIGGVIVLFAGQFIRRLPGEIAQGIPPGIPPFAAWVTSMVGASILAVA